MISDTQVKRQSMDTLTNQIEISIWNSVCVCVNCLDDLTDRQICGESDCSPIVLSTERTIHPHVFSYNVTTFTLYTTQFSNCDLTNKQRVSLSYDEMKSLTFTAITMKSYQPSRTQLMTNSQT